MKITLLFCLFLATCAQANAVDACLKKPEYGPTYVTCVRFETIRSGVGAKWGSWYSVNADPPQNFEPGPNEPEFTAALEGDEDKCIVNEKSPEREINNIPGQKKWGAGDHAECYAEFDKQKGWIVHVRAQGTYHGSTYLTTVNGAPGVTIGNAPVYVDSKLTLLTTWRLKAPPTAAEQK